MAISDAVDEALEVFSLGELADATPTELTQGQRKLVAVARALAADPKLLCLDEPAAGLDAHESVAFGRQLREIVDRGTPILLVDHDMGLVLGICDHVVVLEFGKVIARGTPGEVREDPNVVNAYLGSAADEMAMRRGPSPRSRRRSERRSMTLTRCSSSKGCRPDTTLRRWCATSTCTSAPARWSPCSAPTAPARPRRCERSRASSARWPA